MRGGSGATRPTCLPSRRVEVGTKAELCKTFAFPGFLVWAGRASRSLLWPSSRSGRVGFGCRALQVSDSVPAVPRPSIRSVCSGRTGPTRAARPSLLLESGFVRRRGLPAGVRSRDEGAGVRRGSGRLAALLVSRFPDRGGETLWAGPEDRVGQGKAGGERGTVWPSGDESQWASGSGN